MRKQKRAARNIISFLLTLTLLMGLTYHSTILQVKAELEQDDTFAGTGSLTEKNYVILAEDADTYEYLLEEIEDSVVEDALVPEFPEDNHMMVAELTEEEAESLAKENGIIIEEDFDLVANSLFPEDNNDSEELEIYVRSQEEDDAWFEALIAEEEAAGTANRNEELEISWNLQAIHADTYDDVESYDDEVGNSQQVRVAVLDSGVDYSTGINLFGSIDLVDQEEDECMMGMFQDGTGHGTAIASIIAGNGETGVLGVNPNAELYSVKVLDDSNTAPLSRIIEGIYWCIDNDINIINMSFGTDKYSPALHKAITDAYDANILLVAAAGNHAASVEYPAAFSQVMAVASTDTEAQLSSFSNTGEELDIAAPGERIRVAHFLDGYTITHGTSIAVPHIVGAASLLWEKDLSKSHEFIRQLLDYSAKEIGNTADCGLVDVNQAIAIYDTFAENFDGSQIIREDKIPENTEEPENFAYIDDDENYVEGRWGTTTHGKMVDAVAGNRSIDLKLIKILMLGIKYPDQSSKWKGGENNPWWHGYGNKAYPCNYIGCYELATNIALKGGKPFTFKAYQALYNTSKLEVKGINEKTFNYMMAYINTETVGGAAWTEVLKEDGTKIGGNSKENRKYFLWGCAMHILTDSFSHETREEVGSEWIPIKHTKDADYVNSADNINKVRKRYEVALKAIHYSLNRLEADNGVGLEKGIAGNCSDYYYALKHGKYDGEFRKYKLYEFADANQKLTSEKKALFKWADWKSIIE